jgi:YVTN family beta-propeller protein
MVTQKIPISSGASFAGPYVALSPDGTRAYVTLTNASQLAVIDTTQNTVVTIVSITPNYPVSVAVHPNGKVAYLVSSLGFNGIDVFDLESNTVTGTIAAPGLPVPFNIVLHQTGRRLT